MPSITAPRKLILVALATLLVAALPGTSEARTKAQMQVGFYDDPSFRWSPDASANLDSAQTAGATIGHPLANWSQIAPTTPADALDGNDPAYKLSDLDKLVADATNRGLQLLVTITGTPKWANGGRTQNYPPKSLATLTQFAHMLAARYDGTSADQGLVTRWSIWNEPNLGRFLAPQFRGKTIVSGATYAKLFLAGYRGIKAGNPTAQVAAGETSNRGRNHPTGSVGNDTVAPATFAQLVAKASPHLTFAAWATHPYPTVYALGPGQRVAYPNVALSTMSRFGADLKKWFHRRVPIWITEYGEQTKPENTFGGISYAKQAADLRKALQLAHQNPYVQMFVWFIFRDSTGATWSSGVEKRNGAKKPSYNVFSNEVAKLGL
jgi:hypothetical protein